MRPNKMVTDFCIRLVVYMLYSITGAWVFMRIENKPIEEDLKKLTQTKAEVRNTLSGMLNSTRLYSMTIDQMVNFSKKIVEIENKVSTTPKKWTFERGFRLTFEIMTTIGYGTTPPKTQAGRLLCVFYTLFGIPVFLFFLKSMGEVMNRGMTKMVRYFETKVLKRENTRNVELKVLIGFIFALFLDVLMEAIFLAYIKNKKNFTFIDALYCVIITAITVGFGDLTLENELTMIISLCLLSTVLDGVLCYTEKKIGERMEQMQENKGCQCFGRKKTKTRNADENMEAYGTENRGKCEEVCHENKA